MGFSDTNSMSNTERERERELGGEAGTHRIVGSTDFFLSLPLTFFLALRPVYGPFCVCLFLSYALSLFFSLTLSFGLRLSFFCPVLFSRSLFLCVSCPLTFLVWLFSSPCLLSHFFLSHTHCLSRFLFLFLSIGNWQIRTRTERWMRRSLSLPCTSSSAV